MKKQSFGIFFTVKSEAAQNTHARNHMWYVFLEGVCDII